LPGLRGAIPGTPPGGLASGCIVWPRAGTAKGKAPLVVMSVLKTVIGALGLCAALLVGAAVLYGPDRDAVPVRPAGLTAAAILASDGMGPDGRIAESAPGSPRPRRMILSGAQAAQPAG
jgi:hypothetical protein